MEILGNGKIREGLHIIIANLWDWYTTLAKPMGTTCMDMAMAGLLTHTESTGFYCMWLYKLDRQLVPRIPSAHPKPTHGVKVNGLNDQFIAVSMTNNQNDH